MATTISRLSERVVDDLFTDNPTMFVAVSKAAYVNALQGALIDLVDTDIELSTVTPDYETLMIRLVQALSAIPEWYDLITASTGHAILRSIASTCAYSQFSIERAYQEAYIQSAASDSAIFSTVRMLGERPQRRQPSRTNVQFTRDSADIILTIPEFSIFTVGDAQFFNREAIIFNKNVFTVTKLLFQGVIEYENITSDGEPFQKYVIGDGESNSSDIDVILTVDGATWTRKISGLYDLQREELAYNESTAQNGDIEITFGNGDFGKIPPISSTIQVLWVKTLGADGNIDTSGIDVRWNNPPVGLNLTGITITNIESGAERITADIYQKIAPDLFAADGRAVRRSDYKAQALKFPGVYDALFQGQAELAPGRRSMMNVIGYTLLTDSNWTLANFQNFEDYFTQNLGIWQCAFLRINSIAITQDVIATIYCNPDADLQQVEDKLIDNIQALYQPRPNYLGRSMELSDIDDVLNGRNATAPDEKLEQQVNYVVLDPSMQTITITDLRQYVKLGQVKLTMLYTTRDGTSGKLTLAPNQADTTVIT